MPAAQLCNVATTHVDRTWDTDIVPVLRDYIRIVLRNRFVVTYLRMSRIEDQLPANRFIRSQKSYIVRLDALRAITGNEVELYDLPEKLPIGKQHKEALLTHFGLKQ